MLVYAQRWKTSRQTMYKTDSNGTFICHLCLYSASMFTPLILNLRHLWLPEEP